MLKPDMEPSERNPRIDFHSRSLCETCLGANRCGTCKRHEVAEGNKLTQVRWYMSVPTVPHACYPKHAPPLSQQPRDVSSP